MASHCDLFLAWVIPETLGYDHAARLSAWDDSSGGENISYDARGNITSRSPRHGSGGTVTLTYTGFV